MVSFLHSFVWQHNSVRNILSFCRYFNRCHWSLSMLNVPLHCYWLKVGFPRDGTICELLSFWYETKIFSCLVVPLSRNKGRSKKKIVLKICTFFLAFFYFCPMSCPMAGLNKTGHAGNIPLAISHPSPSKPISWQDVKIPSRPIPWQDFELVLLSLWPETTKGILSLCPAAQENPIPLETLVENLMLCCRVPTWFLKLGNETKWS